MSVTGVADALDEWASLVAQGYEVPAASRTMNFAASELRRLNSTLEKIAEGEYDGVEVTHNRTAADLRLIARTALQNNEPPER